MSLVMTIFFGLYSIILRPTQDLSLGETLETIFTLILTAVTQAFFIVLLIFYIIQLGNEFCGIGLSIYRLVCILMGIGFYGGITINNMTSIGLSLQTLSLIFLSWAQCETIKKRNQTIV